MYLDVGPMVVQLYFYNWDTGSIDIFSPIVVSLWEKLL